jgi:hypothetical protein
MNALAFTGLAIFWVGNPETIQKTGFEEIRLRGQR